MTWLDPPHGLDAHAPCYRARYVGGPYDGRTEITAHFLPRPTTTAMRMRPEGATATWGT